MTQLVVYYRHDYRYIQLTQYWLIIIFHFRIYSRHFAITKHDKKTANREINSSAISKNNWVRTMKLTNEFPKDVISEVLAPLGPPPDVDCFLLYCCYLLFLKIFRHKVLSYCCSATFQLSIFTDP